MILWPILCRGYRYSRRGKGHHIAGHRDEEQLRRELLQPQDFQAKKSDRLLAYFKAGRRANALLANQTGTSQRARVVTQQDGENHGQISIGKEMKIRDMPAGTAVESVEVKFEIENVNFQQFTS